MSGSQTHDRNAPFVHLVVFKLPPDADPNESALLIEDIDRRLRPLPTVIHLERGTPADTKRSDRPMVDIDYDVGLLVLFEDQSALEAYLAHPDHTAFANHWDTRCTVRVFDFTRPD